LAFANVIYLFGDKALLIALRHIGASNEDSASSYSVIFPTNKTSSYPEML